MSGDSYVVAARVRGQFLRRDRRGAVHATAARGKAKCATASKQGPDAFRAAVIETDYAVKASGDEGERT